MLGSTFKKRRNRTFDSTSLDEEDLFYLMSQEECLNVSESSLSNGVVKQRARRIHEVCNDLPSEDLKIVGNSGKQVIDCKCRTNIIRTSRLIILSLLASQNREAGLFVPR